MIKILFCCHGNICRSPMAEFVLKDMVKKRGIEQQFLISSAATSREEIGNDVHPGTQKKLREVGVSVTRRRAIQVTWEDYEANDYLICMDQANIRNLQRICKGDSEHKVCRLLDYTSRPRDITDPWYTDNFDETYNDILEGCEAFLSSLDTNH